MYYKKIFLSTLLAMLVIQILFHYTELEAFKYLLYSIELIFIFSSLFSVIKNVNGLNGKFIYLLIFIAIISINLILNKQNKIDDIFKIFASIVIFLATYYLDNNQLIRSRITQYGVIIVSLLPLLVLVIDYTIGFQENSNTMSIFFNSNNYIFYSICCTWLMMINKISNKLVWCFLVLSFAITSTLGAILGVVLSIIFYFRKKILIPSYFIGILIISLLGIYLVLYSDLYLFQKIRGTVNVFNTLISGYNLNEFSEISFGEAMNSSGSLDNSNLSFLFRIKIWSEILTCFFNQDLVNIFFGMGVGSVPKINSFGLVAHNDYLTWLFETGLIGLGIITYGLLYGIKKLGNSRYMIPYVAILIYFFTENLFFNFFGDMIFMYCLAFSIKQVKLELIINKIIKHQINENFTHK
jgi:hypothetical protein